MAANQSSPGVVVQERDLTTITTLSTANVGVIAAPFELGPVEEVLEVGSERELVSLFGEPNDYNYEYWYTAAQFLSYGGVLKTIRADSDTLKKALESVQVKGKGIDAFFVPQLMRTKSPTEKIISSPLKFFR